ncbi:MAG: nuclear transport factor 2 family protein [Pseudomonadales bacterium]|jgi:ketosteroid isomerase-like protein|nr:nuclear transport factor 2 family protein [Pseudomonadales bacterium]
MEVERNKAVVRAFFEAGNRGDMDACFALIADDVVWHNLGSTRLSGTFRGKAMLMEELLGPLFGSLKAGIRSELEALIGEGDTVVAVTSGTAETMDGRPYCNRYCQLMRIRDGRIVEVTEFADTDLMRRTFG